MPGTRHTPAGRVGAEGKGQGSEGGLRLEGSAEGCGCVCVCVCVCVSSAHDPTHTCARHCAKEAPLGPPVLPVSSHGGGLPGIQGAGSTTFPNQSPRGGGATSLWADPERPEVPDPEPKKGSAERVDLWSSWLRECVLCPGVGVLE